MACGNHYYRSDCGEKVEHLSGLSANARSPELAEGLNVNYKKATRRGVAFGLQEVFCATIDI
ncbi:MAG: hypothetical protein A2401_02440 [Candidatus Staskawiczbacteria bacterium RIFOXYC1_FULL_38_18]|uniref:Uncharacterized protein n=1 Tax=Candidatus Staskawiczbacteria bacterium RIFOXYC1_FULL_38_18 TaxID=1802229 RepID=A0A1G2JEP3_9BACT|nr:MAG: hypothetical protein A2401_02440 [Candidatus Staskawiczbacteria bacterium RIFOXYC1_FULL_38_18]